MPNLTRRDALIASAALLAAVAASAAPLSKPIKATQEALPLVGLGSWITFNVGDDSTARNSCSEVIRAFFAAGGRMIDSSPMYGSSQEVIGYGLKRLGYPKQLFAATKVWTSDGSAGASQAEESRRLWTIQRFDLLLVHNLLSWEQHLPALFTMKAKGQVRYVGVTTSHGRRHDELERIMRTQPIDFIQATYNVADRELESRILPLAQERGVGVIINRPYQGGDLIPAFANKRLPAWAPAIGATSWPQILLKFVISHPAVSCAIPATTRVDHVRENVGAASGPLPDAAMRARIIADIGRV